MHVRRQSVELVVRQVRPDSLGDTIRAKIIKLWTGQAEMIQGGLPLCVRTKAAVASLPAKQKA
jgi:hypothetical protein